jgi:hypothetical protein
VPDRCRLILGSGWPLARVVLDSHDRADASTDTCRLDGWALTRDAGVATLLCGDRLVAELADPTPTSRAVLDRGARVVSRETESAVSAYRLSASLWGFRAS